MPSGLRWMGNSIGYAEVLHAMLEAPHTIEELVVVSGMAKMTVWKFVAALRRRKLAYVSVWRTDKYGRHTKPAYSFGTRADVARPAPKTATQRSQKRYALQAMTRQYDALFGDAPRQDAESKTVEEEHHVPSS